MADYNINAVTRRVVFTGSAGLGPYSFTFEVLDQNDLAVYFNATKLTLTTDYTVTVNANGTGSVTIVTGTNVPSTPTASDQIVIVGARDIERTTDFVTAGDLRASALNEQLDGLTIFDQQIAEEQKRTLQAPVYDPAHVDDGGTLDMTLPAKAARAGKYLQFNSTTGNPEAGPDSADVTALADVATDIATLADIQDGTVATNAITTVSGISANVTTVAGVAANVTTVAGISSDVTAVAADATDIGTVSTNIANVNTVAGISANVTTVAGISSAVSTVAADSADIQAVAADATDIGTVATNIVNVNTVAGQTTNLQNVTDNLTAIQNAASNATNASNSAIAAAASAASAASAFDNFDDTYLGSYSSDPTVDNDGDALVQGALYFNTTANEMRVYDGGSWIAASSAGGASLNLFEYTATAGQTTFSGADDNAATLSYTLANIIVTLNGITLDPSDYTATNGTSVVLASGAALNDELNIIAFKSFTTADMVSATNGGTFGANVTVDGTVTAQALDLGANNPRIRLDDSDTSNNVEIKLDNTSLRIEVDEDNAAADSLIKFRIDGTEHMRILSSGGITFNGDTSSANALNDYEEGTWTVDLQDSSGNSATGINGNGRYIKVGNLVTVWGVFADPNLTGLTSTDDVRIYGLPFTASLFTGSAMQFIGSVRMEDVAFSSSPDGYVNTNIAENGTYIRLVETRNDAIDDFIVVSQISATSEMYFTATYPTTTF